MNGDIENLRAEVRQLRAEFEQFKRWTEAALLERPATVAVNPAPFQMGAAIEDLKRRVVALEALR